jgi:membrane protease YdiL (CAAX protease family)
MKAVMNFASATGFNDPAVIGMLKYFQIVQSFGLFIVPPIILGYLFHGNFIKYLYLNRAIPASSVFIAVMIMISALPLINFIGELNAGMNMPVWMAGVEQWMKASEEKAAKLTEAFLDVKTHGGLLLNLLMIAVLPAFGEEFLFRGVIQRIFIRITQNFHWGIWISAILFSAMHMQFYGFVPRMLLGALFGYLLVWSGSLWIPITAHFINNGIAIVASFYISRQKLSPYIDEIGSTHSTFYLTAISLVFVALLLAFFRKQNRKQSLNIYN